MVPEKIEGMNITFTNGTNNGRDYVGLDMEMEPPMEGGPNQSVISVTDDGDVVILHVSYDNDPSKALFTAGPRKHVKAFLFSALAMLERNETEHTVLEADQNPAR
jgi:hypothetical protein